MASKKQIEILLKNGFTDQQINAMAYSEVSQNIAKIMSRNPFKPKDTEQQKPIQAQPKDRTYHLTPEQVRTNALQFALHFEPNMALESALKVAERIEEWLYGGN